VIAFDRGDLNRLDLTEHEVGEIGCRFAEILADFGRPVRDDKVFRALPGFLADVLTDTEPR
jgi:hypothetical protein